jgi:hypothetical protein
LKLPRSFFLLRCIIFIPCISTSKQLLQTSLETQTTISVFFHSSVLSSSHYTGLQYTRYVYKDCSLLMK